MPKCYCKMETEYECISKENISIVLKFLNLSESQVDAILDDSCIIDGVHYNFDSVVVKIPDQMGTYIQVYESYDEFLKENILVEDIQLL
jgi:hypothetical protein